MSDTPETTGLIARHAAETTEFDQEFHDRHEWAAHAKRQTAELIKHTFELERQRDEAVALLRRALDHTEELRDAWQRGIIDERDGKGGTRSNRNVDVNVAISQFLAKYPKP